MKIPMNRAMDAANATCDIMRRMALMNRDRDTDDTVEAIYDIARRMARIHNAIRPAHERPEDVARARKEAADE